MEDALVLLEKNDEDVTRSLKLLLSHPETKFATVKSAIAAIKAASSRKKVCSDINHLAKYVHLVNLIVENNSHREHLGVDQWQVLADFLFVASRITGELDLNALTYARTISDVTRALSLLLKADESIAPIYLTTVSNICESVLLKTGPREASCHLYIMRCARKLIYFGHDAAENLANYIFQIGKVRSPELQHELLLFACMKGQVYDTLLGYGIPLIPSTQVDFSRSAPEISMNSFRPSAEADLSLFVGALALANSFRVDLPADSNQLKRTKTELSGQKIMAMAFRGDVSEAEVEQVKIWMNSSWAADDLPSSFWALVVLGLHTDKHSRSIFEEWDLALRFIIHKESSSGASFLLSVLVPRLLDSKVLETISDTEKEVTGRLENLLGLMVSSSYPELSSGGLMLYSSLVTIEILDLDFQALLKNSLNIWFANQLKGVHGFHMINQMFDCTLPICYFKESYHNELKMTKEYKDTQRIRNKIFVKKNKLLPKGLVIPELGLFKEELHLAPTRPKNIYESLILLALAAQSGSEIPKCLHSSHTAAFSDSDLKAFCWFSDLAVNLGWQSIYTDKALSLADWSVPANEHYSVLKALYLLQKRSVLATIIIYGTKPPILEPLLIRMTGKNLLELETFMKSYVHQRSPRFLKNLCALISMPNFRNSEEGQQLIRYLLKTSSTQSEFSRLKQSLLSFGMLSKEQTESVLKGMNEITQLAILPLITENYEKLTCETVTCFKAQVCASAYLSFHGCLSRAQLILMDPSEELIRTLSTFPGISLRTSKSIACAFLVPMFLNNHEILNSKSFLVKGPAKRAAVFLKPFLQLDLSLNTLEVAAIVEQLLKEIRFATDLEKASAIQMSHNFILSYVKGSMLTDTTIDAIFLENACASAAASDIETLQLIEKISLKHVDEGRCSIRGSMALFNVGLTDLAMSYLQRSPDHTLKNLLSFDLKRDLKPTILDLSSEGWSEAWNMFIHTIAQTVDRQDFTEVCKQFEGLTTRELDLLIIWSDYLKIRRNKLSAVLSYMAVKLHSSFIEGLENIWACDLNISRPSKPLLLEKAEKNTETYGGSSMKNSQDSTAISARRRSVTIVDIDQLDGLDAGKKKENKTFSKFLSSLDRIYRLLPYKKRRVLNTFLLRSPSIESTTIGLSDIFGEQNWNIEQEFRPVYHDVEVASGAIKAAQSLSDFSLRLLNQPTWGPDVVGEVLELMPNVIPLLVTAAISETLETYTESSAQEALKQALQDCLKSSEDEQIQLAINVHVQCYKQGLPQIFSNEYIAMVCFNRVKGDNKKFSKYYSELGSMFVELLWNKDPEVGLKEEILEILQAFYENLSENASLDLRFALPERQKVPILSKITERCGRWQKLKADMVYNEIAPNSYRNNLKAQSENLGLWKLAQKVEASTNINNLEKAWWLNQWDTYVDDVNDSNFYVHKDYGKLIDFVNNRADSVSLLAELYAFRTPLINTMVKMMSDDIPLIAQDPIASKGYEIKTINSGDYRKYLSLLKVEFSQAFDEGDMPKSLEVALKIENLANGADKFSESVSLKERDHSFIIEAKTVSLIKNAHIEWMIGQQSTAIKKLKSLLTSHNSDCEESQTLKISSGMVDIGEIYCQVGSWSREARDEPEEQILNSYFLESVKFTNHNNSEKIYHSFALFCFEAYQDSFLQSSIQDARHIVNNLTPQFKHISKLIRDGMAELSEDKKRKLQKMYRSVHAQLKARNNDLLELQIYKKSLLIRCAENYIMSMASGDTYGGDMAALISLWLKYHGSKELNEAVMKRLISESGDLLVPSRKFIPWISQLSSRISQPPQSPQHELGLFQTILQSVLIQATMNHPHHTLWHLLKVSRTTSNDNREAQERSKAADTIIRATHSKCPSVVDDVAEFYDRLIELGSVRSSEETKKSDSLTVSGLLGRRKGVTWRTLFTRIRVPVPTVSISIREDCDYAEIPRIEKLIEPVRIAGGISAPKILEFVDSCGNKQQCLLKTSNDDLRQDAIMEQVFSTASHMLTRKSSNLYVRTYNVVPLSATIGIIEFVKNTVALIDILEPMHKKFGGKNELTLSQARKTMSASRSQGRAQRIAAFKEVMQCTKPQMRHYWPQKFKDATQWLTAKTKWCRSTAVMSILGYIIGLGDRHCSNLLVDSDSGDVVHIDLGIAFDQGKLLLIPETVPFRLTRDIVDGMGIIGTNGIFMTSAEETLNQLRRNESQIMTVLEVLRHDTLYTWKLPEAVLRNVQIDEHAHNLDFVANDASKVDNGQAEHALLGVKSKLLNSLSCEATVRDLVTQSRDPANLALIYEGWCPFY